MATLPSAVSIAALAIVAAPWQQVQKPAAAAISGIVVDGTTGEAVPNAVVHLAVSPANQSIPDARQIADDHGRFAFVNLTAPAAYTIAVSKSGYLDGGYGRDRAPSEALRAVTVAAGAWAADLKVPIWRPGSISGVVRDEAGDPLVGIYVRALAMVPLAGRAEVAAGQVTLTDDRGAYRLAGLTPGTYLVQVPSAPGSVPQGTPLRQGNGQAPEGIEIGGDRQLVIGRYPIPPPVGGGRAMTYPPAFHPAASSVSEATSIDVGYGDDRQSVDVTLTPVPSVRVSGIVDGGGPDAIKFLTVRLLPAGLENLGQGAEVASALVDGEGRFIFVNVPAGRYTLDAPLRINELLLVPGAPRVYFPEPAGRRGWNRAIEVLDDVPGLTFVSTDFRGGAGANFSGRTQVNVGATDVSGIVLRLRAGGSMTGRVVLERDPARASEPLPHQLTVTLDPASGESHLGMPRPREPMTPDDTSFAIANVQAGRYWLRVAAQTAPTYSDTAVLAMANRLSATPGWLVKSVQWNGRDYADEPFDATQTAEFGGVVVTTTNAIPELSGTVRDRGELARDRAMVIAFPVDPARWRGAGLRPDRLRASAISTSGAYRFVNLPAGEYSVVAVDATLLSSGAWRDPDFLARAQRAAARVTLRWGAATSQDVDAVVIR